MTKFCIFLCIFLIFTLATTMSEAMDCKTDSGPDSNKPCIFPFKLNVGTENEVTRNACTKDFMHPSSPAWCSTKVDESGGHVKGHYGFCEGKCQPRKLICF